MADEIDINGSRQRNSFQWKKNTTVLKLAFKSIHVLKYNYRNE